MTRKPNAALNRRALAVRAAPAHLEALEPRFLLDGSIVINEIHYDPDVKTQPAEFVELYNTSADPVDLSHWRLSDAVDFEFPETTVLAGHGYVLVAQSPATVLAKWGVTAFGPYTGQLSNEGERIVLRDALGTVVDEVDYGAGFPWPTVGDSPGYSIELINPLLDNDLGGNWHRSVPLVASGTPTTLIASQASWHYRKGTSEPSDPIGAWRTLSFVEDETWQAGTAAIGYGESFIQTVLADMRYNYTTIYLRKTFEVGDPGAYGSLQLQAQYDDGINVWVNGQWVVGAGTSGEDLLCTATSSGEPREDNSFATFTLPLPAGCLVAGTNLIAIQVLNVSQESSPDAFIDVKLIASTGTSTSGPTPGRRNAAYAENAPPQMRQVGHTPESPVAGQTVKVTVKVTDPNGVASVALKYQGVDPGNYIELTDAAYQTNWTSLAMRDDGTNGDVVAGDSVYTVVLPASAEY